MTRGSVGKLSTMGLEVSIHLVSIGAISLLSAFQAVSLRHSNPFCSSFVIIPFSPPILTEIRQVLQCLHEHRLQLSSECHRKLFVRDQLMAVENHADYPLFRACGRMIEVHCTPVIARLADTIDEQAGNHAILECLTDAMDRDRRNRGTFDPVCRRHLWDVMELRAKDYRLDPELQQLCA
ncbi:hypothetical protein AHF37_06846 [Paragonimus kellicotti]|nr:hypothetical protein AHF37_06846 [Paragonimus kellicotti]